MADVRISSVETVASHIVLTASPASFSSITASATIYCNVEIYNAHTTPLRWEPESPVNLTYRWYTSDGEVLVQDGFRISIGHSILPGERRNFSLSVPVPATIGNSILRFSCVHEGHFWFCERFEASGCDVNVSIVEPQAWARELNESVAARALRGSVAAEQLRKLLTASPITDWVEARAGSGTDLVPAAAGKRLAVSISGASPTTPIPSNEGPIPSNEGRSFKRRAFRPLNRILSSLRFASARGLNALLKQSETLRVRHDEIQQSQLLTQTLLRQMMQAIDTQSGHHAEASLRQMEQLQDSIRAQMIKQSGAELAFRRDQSERELAVRQDQSDRIDLYFQTIREYLSEFSKEQFEAREVLRSTGSEIVRMFDEQALTKEAALEAVRFSQTTKFDMASMFAKLDALLWRQVFTLPINGAVICRNSAGLLAIPEEDIDAISFYAGGDLPEPGTLSVLTKLLEVGGGFLDVGANVGLFTLVAARRVGPTGCVWAIEPTHSTAAALKTSIRLNGLENIVTIVECAAGRSSGSGRINIGRTSGHNSMLPLENSQKTASVQVLVLDDVILDKKVDVIKIDVEGWELEVLAGLRRTIAANPDVALILEFAPSHLKRADISISRWLSVLREFGLKIFEIDESSGMLSPLRRTGLSKIDTMNLLMCRQAPIGLLS